MAVVPFVCRHIELAETGPPKKRNHVASEGKKLKIRPVCAIVLACLLFGSYDAFCLETYFLDDQRVLLYKIVNWWYDCLPEESSLLCGSKIKCRSTGDARVDYDEKKMALKLQINGGFADLVSIFKQCERCFGPEYLKCTRLNEKYFGSGEAVAVSIDMPGASAFHFLKIDRNHARKIQSIEKDIVFELEGSVGGLLNGKIALHQAAETFIKTCPEISQNPEAAFPVFLNIVNADTGEVLAKYSTVWED